MSQGGAFVVIKSWLDPGTPVNGGTFRPLEFLVPEGSCLAAQLPAPVGGCWEVYRQLQSSVVGLISQVIPGQPGGETIGSANHTYIAGYDQLRGKYYILYEYPKGGTPATIDTDGSTGHQGYDAGDIPSVYPAESAEQRQPLLMEGLSARIDGESPGYRRSGFGVVRRVKVLADGSQLSVMTDRAIIPPWGAAGAYPGSLNSYTVVRDGEEIQLSNLPGKVKGFPLKAGDVVLTQATAGGVVGDPLDRELDMVRKDVIEGYVTPQRARDAYGVVIDDGQVHVAETSALRESMKRARTYLEVTASPDDELDERGLRLCALSGEDAARVGVGDGEMVEYIGKSAAPLRAWAKVEDGLPSGRLPLGPIGRDILKVAAGDRLWLRKLEIARSMVTSTA